MGAVHTQQNHEALVHIRYRLLGVHYELETSLTEAKQAKLAALAGLILEALTPIENLVRELAEE